MSRPLSSKYSVELGFSFDRWLGSNLELWRNAVIHQDIDCFILVDGKEGSGKSVHALQIAHFLDIERRIDLEKQVCFTPEEVKQAITTLPKFKAIVYDEAKRGLNRRRSTENTNLELTELFAECRQNNLFLVVVLPAFHDLDMNVAVFRSRVLIHVYYKWDLSNRDQPLVRGFARFYNEEAKKYIYCNKAMRQQYKHPRHKDSFDYRFPHHYVVDEPQYREMKRKAVEDYNKQAKPKKPVCSGCGSAQVRYIKSKEGYTCRKCPTLTKKKADGWGVSPVIRKKVEA